MKKRGTYLGRASTSTLDPKLEPMVLSGPLTDEEIVAAGGHVGIAGDQRRRRVLLAVGKTPCVRCSGTGNQLGSMYQGCWLCGATGEADPGRMEFVCEHGNTVDESCVSCGREGPAFHHSKCACPVTSVQHTGDRDV